MSLSIWMADARRLAGVDRAHREAKQSSILGKKLVPVGKVSRFLTVCFAVAIGSLMLMPFDRDVPINVPILMGAMLVFYAPFAGSWLKLTDFERLHAPPAGLLLLRLGRLAPYLGVIGVLWMVMLATHSDNIALIAAIGLMPFALSLAHMLRNQTGSSVLRIAIAGTFLGGLVQVADWLPMVTLALDLLVVGWFLRDLGSYDRNGFLLEPTATAGQDPTRFELADSRPLPDVRASRRRTLMGSAWFAASSSQRDFFALMAKRPLQTFLTVVLLFLVWMLPLWASGLAVWSSRDGVSVIWPLLAAGLSVAHLTIERPEQAYLWGVDLRQIERHNLITRLLTVALPSCLVATACVLLFGASSERWAVVALVAGSQLCRAGCGAGGLGSLLPILVFAALVITAFAVKLLSVHAALVVAAILVVLGVVGIAMRLGRPEHALRQRAFA
tara:strand:- start:34203 stop:35531 length:1329 start_codon:yes stop_codon:yes gene_type:complete